MISLPRFLSTLNSSRYCLATRIFCKQPPSPKTKYIHEQMHYIESVIENKIMDWPNVKKTILEKQGNINEKNFEGIFLKALVKRRQFEPALSYAEHLRTSNKELSLGSINGLLNLYHYVGLASKLSASDKQFILETYKYLYDKYKILDYMTSENLLHALCAIGEWKKCFKIIEDIFSTTIPSSSAYSTLIATLFDYNRKAEALNIINESLAHKRQLQHNAYQAWINYILKNNENKQSILKHLEDINQHISNNSITVDEGTANVLLDTYKSLDWYANIAKVIKRDGRCTVCNAYLERLKLSDDEFKILQSNIKNKLIVGSDLFLKTSPEELERFLKFLEGTAPYDIVIDALNVAFGATNNKKKVDKVYLLTSVVKHFRNQNKKTLLLGRKHMLNWSRKPMENLMSLTASFFTDDLSQDDPYFITAAILSGPHADIVSNDLLRGHRFQMEDERLRMLFRRWQWQHQCTVLGMKVQEPLCFTPCAQKNNGAWHIPFQRDDDNNAGKLHDGTPSSWLCLRPKPGT